MTEKTQRMSRWSGGMADCRPVARVGRGALAGLAGTGILSLVLRLVQGAGRFRDQPPRQITGALLRKSPAVSRKEGAPLALEGPLSVATHLAFGMSNGALYAAVRPRLRRLVPAPDPVLAMGYAVVLWGLSYQGWLPALRLMPPASKDNRGRQGALLGGHLLYGLVVDTLLRASERPPAAVR